MDILKILQDLSFTEYEAKAYLALLQKSPLTGYAVSLNSGVPRSKVYEVLSNMVSRGDIIVSPEATPLYIPLSPKELIASRQKKAAQIFDNAGAALEQYTASSQNRDSIWNISGHETIIQRIKDGIGEARQRILLEIWKEDFEEIKEDLKKAHDNGIKIMIVSYGELECDFALVYPHDKSEQITAEYGGRWVVFSADDCEVVAGIVSLGSESRAAWTKHPGLVMPITEVVIHDMYIEEILNEFRDVLEDKFGPNLCKLREKFVIGPEGKKYYKKS